MKRTILLPSLAVAVLAGGSAAMTISSRSTGGAWEDTLTWVQNVVPGGGDSVSINGTVDISGNASCGTLTVNNSAVLENAVDRDLGLQVNGDLIDGGTIRDNPGSHAGVLAYLAVHVTGNVSNNGIMSQTTLGFNGPAAQHLGGTTTFTCKNIDKNPDGHLIATSALEFDTSTTVSLSGDTLDMGSFKLTARSTDNATMKSGIVTSSGQIDVAGPFGCHLIGTVSLTGSQPMQIAFVGYTGGTIWARGATTIASGKVVEAPDFYGYHWQILGNLTNNGTIRNNPAGNQLLLHITGDLVNNGVMTQQTLDFNGDSAAVQHIGGTQKFDCKNIGKSPDGRLTASSALVFDTMTTVDFSGDTLAMGANKLTIRSTDRASFTHGVISSNGEIDASGPFGCHLTGTISLTGSQPMQIATIGYTGGTTWAKGSVTIASGKIIEAPDFYGYHWQILGNLTNNGTIRNNPAGNQLMLHIAGDLVNNGVMTQQTLEFNGDSTAVQHIGGTQKFDCKNIAKTPDGRLTASSALVFDTLTSFDLSGDTLVMGSYKLTARSTDAAFLSRGTVSSNGHVDITGPFGSNLLGNVTLTGSAPMMIVCPGSTGGGIAAYGSVTVDSGKTLQAPGYYGYSLGITGNLVNNGAIRNNPAGNQLILFVGGDVYNNGTWTNQRTTLNGAAAQKVMLINNRPVRATFILACAPGNTGPYQWHKDRTVIPGQTAGTYYLDSVTTAAYGVYSCAGDSASSRTITIGQGTVSAKGLKPAAPSRALPGRYAGSIAMAASGPVVNYQLPRDNRVSLTAVGVSGRAVVLVKERTCAGYYRFPLNQCRLPAGAYVVVLTAGEFTKAMPVFLVR